LRLDVLQFPADLVDSCQILADCSLLRTAEMRQHLGHQLHLNLRVGKELTLHLAHLLDECQDAFL
jgi:hypothetical protein